MANLTQNQENKLKLLETSLGVEAEGGELFAGEPSPVLCAALQREELLQFKFMVAFQGIILILALAVLALLLFAAWRVAAGAPYQALISGAGALVSAGAAIWFERQRADARDTHTAAQAGLEKYRCP